MVGREDRVQSRFDPSLRDDKGDALEVRLAVELERREAQRSRELQLLVRQQRIREPPALYGIALLLPGLSGEPENIDPRRSEGVEPISKAARLGRAPARPRYGGPLLEQGAVDPADARKDDG